MDVTNVKARSITTSEDSTNERGKQQQGNIKNTFLSPIIAIKSSKMKINWKQIKLNTLMKSLIGLQNCEKCTWQKIGY